jgi:hypothetical protein
MPTGTPYFAWIAPDEVVFLPGHMRWDESIFSFALKQEEGDPASLTAVVRRPRNEYGETIGLLGPGRKIWCWFAFDCDGGNLITFRGRLVGIPTSIFEELVTLEFIARPFDVKEQKEALAETLRVLPYYDVVMIDKDRRKDPEVVLEGYTAIWYYPRDTHVLAISDEILGEDGTVVFDGESEPGKVMWDGLGLTLATGPLARVDVKAEFTWTQQARGQVDLSRYITGNWPNEVDVAGPNVITSFTLNAESWPKAGAGLGDGWSVASATARTLYNLEVKSTTEGAAIKIKWPKGGGLFGGTAASTEVTVSETKSFVTQHPAGSIGAGLKVTKDDVKVTYSKGRQSPFGFGQMDYVSGLTRNLAGFSELIPLYHTAITLVAEYAANRACTEVVEFSLIADVQSIMTDPEDGEALTVDDLRSVNLSEPIDPEIGTASGIPMEDARRRSYIATERGNRSLEYCIAIARAHLLKRARAVEITFAPKLSRMPEITLRKNVSLIEPRVGEAFGKIIGYSLELDGNDGEIKCEVKIGCAIGRGGSVVASPGTPVYCDEEYVGADYQQYTDMVVTAFDSSVGYSPPQSDPNDDGVEFLSTLTPDDVMHTHLTVENPPAVQRTFLRAGVEVFAGQFWAVTAEAEEERINKIRKAHADAVTNAFREHETKARFKLKSMTREFETPYEIQVTDLKIPTGYDLEAE